MVFSAYKYPYSRGPSWADAVRSGILYPSQAKTKDEDYCLRCVYPLNGLSNSCAKIYGHNFIIL